MSKKKKVKINVDPEAANTDSETKEATPKNNDTSDRSENTADDVAEDVAEDVAIEDPLKEMEAKLNSAREEAKENYERLLRVSAEFENYKKRAARDMDDIRKFANQSLLKEMLSVVDNLELAINSANENQNRDDSLKKGLDLMHKEILRVFEKFAVRPIESKGQVFDPAFHEAVMQEETDDYPENTVVTEMQKGYLIHDRLLRPAMVVVAKPKAGSSDSNAKRNET